MKRNEITKREFVGEIMNFTGEEMVKFRYADSQVYDDQMIITGVSIQDIMDHLTQRDDHWVEIGDHLGIQKVPGECKFFRF